MTEEYAVPLTTAQKALSASHKEAARLAKTLNEVIEQRDRAEAENERLRDENVLLKSLAQWLVAMDEPGSTARRTITLTAIIEHARSALAGGGDG